MKKIISLCDYTCIWPTYYLERPDEYEVVSYDIQTTGHDIRMLKDLGQVHGVLAAPPCTVFASSGARWERSEDDMLEGISIVDACLRIAWATGATFWAIENPVGKLVRFLGKPKMYFQPHEYAGHADFPEREAYTKKTGLWGEFNTNLPLANIDPSLGSKMHTGFGGKSERTKNARSATPQGFARAFGIANP